MIDPDIEDIKIRMNVIKHKILVMSGKGGFFISQFSNLNLNWQIKTSEI